ncbi:MAG: hypothetical protein ACI4C7_09185 [Clostridia bacterium]
MNIAAKRIHHRKYEKKRLRLPIWALVMMIFMLTVLTSAIAAVNVADRRISSLIQHMPDTETVYVQTTGKYPDWFIEWMNTVYLSGEE